MSASRLTPAQTAVKRLVWPRLGSLSCEASFKMILRVLWSTPFSHLVPQTKGYWGHIQTRILTGLVGMLYYRCCYRKTVTYVKHKMLLQAQTACNSQLQFTQRISCDKGGPVSTYPQYRDCHLLKCVQSCIYGVYCEINTFFWSYNKYMESIVK